MAVTREKLDYRERMNRFIRTMVEHGTPYKEAKRIAQETARRRHKQKSNN